MPYLIDSDWVIDHLSGTEEAVQLLDHLVEKGIAISIITYMEVYQGIERSSDKQEAQAKLAAFLAAAPVIPLSLSVAQRCAQLREQLKRQGKRVNARALDLIVAATALEHNLTLVTRNTDDYKDIPGLRIHRPD